MDYALLALSVGLGTGKNILSKAYPKGKLMRFNSICFFAVFAVGVLFVGADGLNYSPFVVGMSLLYALCSFLALVAYMIAVSIGDFAISSLMYSCGFVLPSIIGVVAFSEPFTGFQIAGLIIMVASFVVGNLGRSNGKSGKLWLLLSITAMLASGGVGVVQKYYRISAYGSDLDSLIIMAFLVMAVMSAAAAFIEAKPYASQKLAVTTAERGAEQAMLAVAVALGVIMLAQNKVNLFLSGALPSMLFFPVCNGGTVVLSAVCDRVLFGKKMDLKKLVSVIMGVVAIVLMVIK